MKLCLESAIVVFLHLNLLNCVLPVVESTCEVGGDRVYETGDRLILSCVCSTQISCPHVSWHLRSSSKGNASILTTDKVTLDDSGVYLCACDEHTSEVEYPVLVFEARLFASTIGDDCEVAIVLSVVARDRNFSVTHFHCPTLESGNHKVWNFSQATNYEGNHVIRRVAIGYAGGLANHTCNFLARFYPNGEYPKFVSKTVHVHGAVDCSKAPHKPWEQVMEGPPPTADGDTQFNPQLTTVILIAFSLLYHLVK